MVKISDIARALEISDATVSNALTGKGRMKPETREAVCEYARRMGYQIRPRRSAQIPGRLIAVAESLSSLFITTMLTGVYDEAESAGLTIPVYSLRIEDAASLRNPDISTVNRRVKDLLSSLSEPVSGILYLSQYARRADGLLNDCECPVVSTFLSREDGLPFVHYNDHQGARLAVDALLDEGRKRIAMISGPIDSIGMFLRSSGYQQSLVEHGFPYDPRLVRIGDWDDRSGYELTRRLLDDEPDIDGIFAQNDQIALGAIRALSEHGMRIPEDVSVIGFDNTLYCNVCVPQLTSIMPPFREMGSLALRRLCGLVSRGGAETESPDTNSSQAADAKKAGYDNSLLNCTLIRRGSTLS